MKDFDDFLATVPGATAQLAQASARWEALKQGAMTPPTVVTTATNPLGGDKLAATDWDVVICGGTLGLLLAVGLVRRGWRVLVLERGVLQGRVQEWNISRAELQTLLDLEILTLEELEAAIATEYNPARIQFHGGTEYWVEDVLNLGVSPRQLLAQLKTHFLAAGGQLQEHTAFKGAVVHPDGVEIRVQRTGEGASAQTETLTTRLLLDGMGHFSPITQQARQGKAPDGVCLVVGTCAEGYPARPWGDLLVSRTPIQRQCQYFWEAFPAQDGRTVYLFTYLDAQPGRLGLRDLCEDYFDLLPGYQGVELTDLTFLRFLLGCFPCYRDSPLPPRWARILPVGDSSGQQSPLSFGGFGAMLRHLARLLTGLDEALGSDCLDRGSLGLLQPYQPNLAVTWLFQAAMRVKQDQTLPPNQINDLLDTVFGAMEKAGPNVLKPFLQDVVQFPALTEAMARTLWRSPPQIARVIPQVGVPALLSWLKHYVALGGYQTLQPLAQWSEPWLAQLPPPSRYRWHQRYQALRYGAGQDYASGGKPPH